jgi:ribosomal protein L29
MDFSELKIKTVAELNKLLKADREKMRDLRFKVANKQLKDIRQLRGVKKDIAKILTVLNGMKESVKPQPTIKP